ncbi:MAG: PIN domain-containing protein [Candidatus Electrothrix sp. AUS1_2]|nr:PIN domain-containing protein [Candidatus Electrothrix sp. AUS1_2]
MTALLDTSFLLAMTNAKDRNHHRVLHTAERIDDQLVLPVTVLPEVSYLIGSRLGHKAMRQFLHRIVASNVALETVTTTDLKRVTEILEEYADSRLDFVDATLVAIGERLNITRVLTLDRRDFSIIRPAHCSYFEILP